MRRRPAALALGETLVSLTLLTLVMVAVLNLFPSSLGNARLTRTGWLARTAAQDKIEQLAARPFATLEPGYREMVQVKLADGVKATLVTTISAVDGHPPKLLKQIRCQATWPGRGTSKTATEELHVHSLRR